MANFYIGMELIRLWKITDAELFDFMKRGLRTYDQQEQILVNDETVDRPKDDYALYNLNLPKELKREKVKLKEALIFVFLAEDVERFAEEHGLPAPPERPTPEPEQLPEIPVESEADRKFRHRLAVRKIAKQIWTDDPAIKISSMAERPEIIEAAEGKSYRALYAWIKDIAPHHLPGRRKTRT
ncbi:MAG: hypothetical protein HQK57_11270 [Deltaproteobacteria bacterium]|nr:hypothetical protein [Deltaproteobacteria bacterium]